ncbi:uncharacterized protein LOC127253191 [Andrographis paniculata]|uniref:uncharacterized protein LOC127253191 n=1 Tax=Andrographis paniculata TaxID=175694 RepID=UPI0021E74048|nr:uncharacterized protein LOC127253191 [Andrographis paniculata]
MAASAAATAKLIETHRKGAEIYQGEECKDIILKLLEEFKLPNGLLPRDEIVEIGLNRSTGFLWLKLKKKSEIKFRQIGQTVLYSVEMTGFVEPGHLSKLTGVKGKEMMIAVVISDVLVGFPSPDMIKFTTPVGLSRAHPVSAFQLPDEPNSNPSPTAATPTPAPAHTA